MKNHVDVIGLSKSFPDFRLEDITFALPHGYIMGLIGPNGSGKTTTIKLLLDMLRRDSGEIKISGVELEKRTKEHKQDIAAIFDQHCFCEEWDTVDTQKALAPFYPKWDRDKYQQMIEAFHLPVKLPVKKFSRGMQLKLMLACALSHGAELLILDEPTSGLDPFARDELLTILAEYISDGTKSVIFSTHITSDLEKLADYITYIQKGKMIYSGGKDEFVDSFRRISGGRGETGQVPMGKVIGYRETSTDFEGLIRTGDAENFSSLQIEPVTIEEIMIFGGMGGFDNE